MKLDWRRSAVLTRLSGPRLFDRTFFWWTYFAAFALQITFDVIAYDSPSLLWLPVWTIGHLLATAVAIVIRFSFLDRWLEKKPNPFLNIAIAGLLGVVRIMFIGYASFELGLQDLFDPGARVAAGVIAGVVGFVVIVSYTESSRSYREVSKQLLSTQQRLEQSRNQTKKSIRESQQQVQATLRQLVGPELEEISKRLKALSLNASQRNDLTKELQRLLEDQVRPLSNSFRMSKQAASDSDRFRQIRRTSLYRLPEKVAPHLALRPFLVFLGVVAIFPFALYVLDGASWVSSGLLISFANFLSLVIFKLLLSKTGLMARWQGIATLSVAALIPIMFSYTYLVLRGFPAEKIPVVMVIYNITLVVSMTLFALMVVHDYNRDTFLAQLKKNNARLERELALLNQKLWVEKRQWALRIHGTIQASLTAAIARLSKPGKLSASEIRSVQDHIRAARRGISQQPKLEQFDFLKALNSIRQAWKGVLEIKIPRSGDAIKLLAADRWAGICANEIVKESVSNSLRHGKATSVQVRFEQVDSGFVEIVVEDNGRGLPSQFRPGLGSQILDEIAFPWSLQKLAEGGTRLRARIPVGRRAVPKG
jgi:signal transduction histidine kinase